MLILATGLLNRSCHTNRPLYGKIKRARYCHTNRILYVKVEVLVISIPPSIQVLFSDLEQRAHDAQFSDDFDPRGAFLKRKRSKRYYWYWQKREGKKVVQKYVGPVTDKHVSDRVERFESLKQDFDERRQIVRTLISAGLPSTDFISGEITHMLGAAGFFRLRGILVGSTGFQCYSGILGQRLPEASLRTQDADFAQFFAIANQIDDSIPDVLGVLKSVDRTFAPVPHITAGLATTAFVNSTKYKVEFLTPNRGSDDYEGQPAPMRALGGVSAEPLRFLDYLIRNPIRSVLLHEAGVPVTVPAPERYAIHKLIVAERRHELSKVDKDLLQAEQLITAMAARRGVDLSAAWQEAWERGPKWREHLTNGLSRIRPEVVEQLKEAVRAGAARRRKPFVWPT